MNNPATHFLLKFFSSNANCLHPIMSLSLTPPKKKGFQKNTTDKNTNSVEYCCYSILIVIWKSCLKRFVILHKVNGLYMYIQNKWFLVTYNSDRSSCEFKLHYCRPSIYPYSRVKCNAWWWNSEHYDILYINRHIIYIHVYINVLWYTWKQWQKGSTLSLHYDN